MATLRSLPDGVAFDSAEGESLLDAATRAGIPMARACGGRARCSTCRIWLLQGDAQPAPGEPERAMKERAGLGEDIRLACQLRPTGALEFRRLVIDATDLALANQLTRQRAPRAGDMKTVAVMFFDVTGFSAISARLPPYDVLYLLNRFYTRAEEILTRHGGYFDKAVGDGFVAIFGAGDEPEPALRSVAAALEILRAVDAAQPLMRRLYGVTFTARIGLDYGEALIGSLGPAGQERLTAIGDVANTASRVEAANKDAGTRLLITEALHAAVKDDVVAPDFLRVRLRGGMERRSLYEVTTLTAEAKARLETETASENAVGGRRRWTRVMDADALSEGGHAIVPLEAFDLALIRRDGRVAAFNNACPHLRLPFFGVEVEAQGPIEALPSCSEVERSAAGSGMTVLCRWHRTRFDLATGEILSWCEGLTPQGWPPGMAFLGDISKNAAPLEVYPCREAEGGVWVALG